MRESSWRNYEDADIPDEDEDEDDPLAPIPPQPGFDNELWHDREDDELGEVEEDEEDE